MRRQRCGAIMICAEEFVFLLGADQVVDMRWGVRDEMTNEHATTALCMNELRGCQKYSMGPNFIYFGGQKYGYRPIPSEIVTEELDKLIEVLETMNNDTTLLKKWYRKDNNKVVKLRSPQKQIDLHMQRFRLSQFSYRLQPTFPTS